MEETVPILRAQADVRIKGLMVSLNRMEQGKAKKSALSEIRETYGFPTNAIVTMADVIEHLSTHPYSGKMILEGGLKDALKSYYDQYGADEYREIYAKLF
jgi:orotate phosphoribosyltransferase